MGYLVYASLSSVSSLNDTLAFKEVGGFPFGKFVRCYEEGKQADGARVQPPLRDSDGGIAFLHGLRSLGRENITFIISFVYWLWM